MKKYIVIILVLIMVLCSASFSYATDSAIKDSVLEKVEIKSKKISSSDANGLKSVLLDMIGDYEAVITDYTYQNYNGTTQHSINVEKDWSWIMSCAMFIVVVYCVFRAIGGIICK